jgi:hypothetical protein
MATVYKELLIHAPAAHVWDAVRDFHAAHLRLFPGLLTDSQPESEARVVTFANGMVFRELLLSVDEAQRRLAFAAIGGPLTHHNASFQVFELGPDDARLVWITDVLPNEVRDTVAALVEQGAALVKMTLERSAQAQRD